MAGTPFGGPAGGCFLAGAASDSTAGAVAAVVIGAAAAVAAAAGWLGPVTGFLGSVALILTTWSPRTKSCEMCLVLSTICSTG